MTSWRSRLIAAISHKPIPCPRADFYLIDKPAVPRSRCCWCANWRAQARAMPGIPLVLARDAAQAEALDDLLWSFDPDAHVPHQIAGADADEDDPGADRAARRRCAARPLLINLRDAAPQGACERVLEVVPADPRRAIRCANAGSITRSLGFVEEARYVS